MHRHSISTLVYRHLYPFPKSNDPSCFALHLQQNLIPEVRTETSTFYGTLDSIEARYPGLDYTHPPHRMRLGRFVHHRRLFRAFDELGLTKAEILGLCRWEGTRWARESFERQEGCKVRDTTGDEIRPWVPPAERPSNARAKTAAAAGSERGASSSITAQCHADDAHDDELLDDEEVDDEVVDEDEEEDEDEDERDRDEEPEDDEEDDDEEVDERADGHQPDSEELGDAGDDEAVEEDEEEEDDDDEGHGNGSGAAAAGAEHDEHDDSDGELHSVGVELNRRLNAAAQAREQGASDVVMDEEWEQWLKEQREQGTLFVADARPAAAAAAAARIHAVPTTLAAPATPAATAAAAAAAAAAAPLQLSSASLSPLSPRSGSAPFQTRLRQAVSATAAARTRPGVPPPPPLRSAAAAVLPPRPVVSSSSASFPLSSSSSPSSSSSSSSRAGQSALFSVASPPSSAAAASAAAAAAVTGFGPRLRSPATR